MERRQQGRALATIPAETEGEEEAEALETEKLEYPPTHISGVTEGVRTQETAREPKVKEEDAGEETEGVNLINTRNGFNEISRLAMLWTVRHR